MRIQDELITRKKYLEETLNGAQCYLKTAPGGSLRANQKNGVSQYYIRTRPDDRKGTYVRKKEISKAQDPFLKRFLYEFLLALRYGGFFFV